MNSVLRRVDSGRKKKPRREAAGQRDKCVRRSAGLVSVLLLLAAEGDNADFGDLGAVAFALGDDLGEHAAAAETTAEFALLLLLFVILLLVGLLGGCRNGILDALLERFAAALEFAVGDELHVILAELRLVELGIGRKRQGLFFRLAAAVALLLELELLERDLVPVDLGDDRVEFFGRRKSEGDQNYDAGTDKPAHTFLLCRNFSTLKTDPGPLPGCA